jgi:hypothetical protein
MDHTLRVGSIVHYCWTDMGFTLTSAALVTRIYEMIDKERPALCVDLAIFPAYGDRYTPTKEGMVWHRDSTERDSGGPQGSTNRWWQWGDEGEGGGA